jgi:putative CocE/NonD family hydrolase
MALVNPHPALKVAVPMNPMVDGWMGDDWFHNGAFRQQNMSYIYEQEATRDNTARWYTSHFDDYDMFMQAGSAGELGRIRGLEQVGFWRKILAHPSYDAFWKDQAVDKILAGQPLKVPTMLVHSLWDAEDIYGAIAVYQALEPKDTANDMVFLVLGPWHHGGEIEDGSTLGALRFEANTSLYFQRRILRPFLDHYLKDDAPKADVPPVSAFETGTNTWRRLDAWPAGCDSGCTVKPTPLHLLAGSKLGFTPPKRDDAPFDEYVSDPARPVPFRARPIQPVGYDNGLTWPDWLADDQREASGRTDVAVFTSDVLTAPVKISGQPVANLIASTSGTDADWVVKLIDVYPDEVAGQPEMGGYQLMVSADIFRGRYRESLETPKPIAANQPLPYRFALPTANHVFLPGHRIMVQIQSSWFPLLSRARARQLRRAAAGGGALTGWSSEARRLVALKPQAIGRSPPRQRGLRGPGAAVAKLEVIGVQHPVPQRRVLTAQESLGPDAVRHAGGLNPDIGSDAGVKVGRRRHEARFAGAVVTAALASHASPPMSRERIGCTRTMGPRDASGG